MPNEMVFRIKENRWFSQEKFNGYLEYAMICGDFQTGYFY